MADHPGIERFHEVLVGLTRRPDVESAYAQIAELGPDEDMWPFTDTVLVVWSIAPDVCIMNMTRDEAVAAYSSLSESEELRVLAVNALNLLMKSGLLPARANPFTIFCATEACCKAFFLTADRVIHLSSE